MPITKYARNYDSGIDLSEEEKSKIRDEVARVLNMEEPNKSEEEVGKKRQKVQKKKGLVKKKKFNESIEISVDSMELESIAPEVVFADVNDIKVNQSLDVKDEIPNTLTPLGLYLLPLFHIKICTKTFKKISNSPPVSGTESKLPAAFGL